MSPSTPSKPPPLTPTTVFNLACGFAQNKGELIAFRFISGLGGSAPLSVGGGVLGDIYKVEERGTAIGLFMGVRVSMSRSHDEALNALNRHPFLVRRSPRSQAVSLPIMHHGG